MLLQDVRGSEFLGRDEAFWPTSQLNEVFDTGENFKETDYKSANVSTILDVPNGLDVIFDLNSYKSFNKLVSVTCYVQRFISNLMSRRKGEKLRSGATSMEERDGVKQMWLMYDQQSITIERLNQLVVSLGAYKDDNGIIKLKGRLEHSDLPTSAKFPVFIRRDSFLGDLIIHDAHERVKHSGIKDTLCQMRSEYWLSRGRERVRKYLNRCSLCKKFEAKPLQELPAAPLPDYRSQCCDPFTHVGIDYLGPLFAYPTPSGKDLGKVHVVLYTCANSRAVHLDIVPDASSSALVNSLKRFVSRRGRPRFFISDNAKCFLGPELMNFLKTSEISWKYILEVSPWWGGFWERMVQVVKRSLRKILRRTSVTYDGLFTVITEIEGIINNRPLCYMYSDDIEEALTPSHLIFGRRLMSDPEFPEEIHNENENTLKKRLAYLSYLSKIIVSVGDTSI